ncbi:MAG: mechanosensitive ion channel [Saprospiraceae bacterium]|nr:mechanosensitive ion channel [Saprospiraceae bacterium]
MKRIALLIISTICWVVAIPSVSLAQQADSVTLLKELIPDSNESVSEYINDIRRQLADTAFSENLFKVEQIGLRLTELNQIVASSYDTLELSRELPGMERLMELMRTNVLEKESNYNLRSLYMSQVAINQFAKKLELWQKNLLQNNLNLRSSNQELTQFLADSSFRNTPSDSTLRNLYVKQLTELARQIITARLQNQKKLVAMSIWQGRVADDYLEVLRLKDAISIEIRQRNHNLWRDEMGYLWSTKTIDAYHIPYKEVITKSLKRNRGLLEYYVKQHYGHFAFLFLIWAGLAAWLYGQLNRIRKTHTESAKVIENAGFTARFPLAAALVAVLAATPLLFVNPPIGFLQVIWTVQFALLTMLVVSRVNWMAKGFWLILLLLFVGYSIMNLTVQNNYTERNILLFFNGLCIVMGWLFLKKPDILPKDYGRFLVPLTWIMILLQVTAMLLLVFGRFTLAKIISVGALFNIVLAIELYIAIEFVKAAIYIQMESLQTRQEDVRQAAEFDWERIQKQFNNILNWIAIALWVVALAQNFNVYEYLDEAARNFLNKERSIGSTIFTFGSIGIFILIIWLSSLISGLITQLFGGFNQQFVGVRKNRLGSAMLLVRLGVLTGGFLLAVSASGIALDKLTIVFGALGVGIGFGLQNIVNNLVSGIILAFEKPLQVGDLIEVGTRKGIVREIGFRSSKIATYDGANVIIPNGDLLSQHLINWTMNGRQQRSELLVGVAYGTDLDKAQQIMLDCCLKEENILDFPTALALVHEFADNAINLRLLYWINDSDNALGVKSRLLNKIHELFAAAEINIPFPQRELHIRSIDPSVKSMIVQDITQETTSELPE